MSTERVSEARTGVGGSRSTPDGSGALHGTLRARETGSVPLTVAEAHAEYGPRVITHGECGTWWLGKERSHASCCHRTFTCLSAFERHRRGLRCNDPSTVGLVPRPGPGGELWGWPAPTGGMRALYDSNNEEAAS